MLKPNLTNEDMSNNRHHRLAIIGTGVVGTVLGLALKECGYTISGVADSNAEIAECVANRMGGVFSSTNITEVSKKATLILITTPDGAIAKTCQNIAFGGGFSRGDVVLHCSGALSSEILNSAHPCGACVASMHPMGVFADVETALKQLSELYFCLEGDTGAVEAAEMIVKDMGGKPLRIQKEKKIWAHIAACLSSNYVLTLTGMAVQLLHHLQMSREEAMRILLPLLKGSTRALEEKGLPEALTGPIARGDVSTIKQHAEALQSDKDVTRIYSLLGLKTLPIAQEKGTIKEDDLRNLKNIFDSMFSKNSPM